MGERIEFIFIAGLLMLGLLAALGSAILPRLG